MSDFPQVVVGDVMVCRQPSGRGATTDTEVRVAKVGRKYFTVESSAGGWRFQRAKFWRDTGEEVTEYGGPRMRLGTPEYFRLQDERTAALQALSKAGVDFRYGMQRQFSNDQIRRMAQIVAEVEE